MRERDEALAALTACKAEYAEYVRGRPGEWYVVQLQKEADKLKAALQQILTEDLFGTVAQKIARKALK